MDPGLGEPSETGETPGDVYNTPMKTILLLTTLILSSLALSLAEDAPAPDREFIPPAFRAERHFSQAVEFLSSMPDGTRITLNRADGSHFMLVEQDGTLNGKLNDSRLEQEAHVLVTPMGYKLYVDEDFPMGMVVEAPNGKRTLFSGFKKAIVAHEDDARAWMIPRTTPALRLPDGSRIDFLNQARVFEALTLHGERFRMELADRVWISLEKLPSPPLVPFMNSVYPAGDGNDWRGPAQEDHFVLAWNWYPYGLTLDRVIKDLSRGHRREDVDLYFNDLAFAQSGLEVGGILLARRFALNGGDQLTIELPGQEAHTVFVLPGPLEPNYGLPPEKPHTLNLKTRETDKAN